MSELSRTNLGGLMMRAPLALRWLHDHPLAIPSRMPGSLDRAGLVEHRDGRPLEHHHSLGGVTPYGKLSENLLK
jgi:hypothetical protein